ncbi:hypothetical protein L0Y40_01060 [Candidatus Wolfebacteria bacterium]|nr:hypothetical protein [Candidatus Wolfebacteria bacterium]
MRVSKKEMFERISQDERHSLAVGSVAEPFVSPAWERMLTDAFPYMVFEHYLYNEKYEVRITKIGNRATAMPFSDGGDVISRNSEPLPLTAFYEDLKQEFGKNAFVRINELYCSVAETEGFSAPIADFRVVLKDDESMIRSFRKTLRHVLGAPLSMGVSIEKTKDSGTMRRVYYLYLENIRSAAALALPWEAFSVLVEEENNELWVFKVHGNVRAASLFLNTSRASHYYISAGDAQGKEHFGSHRILWHAMKTYAKEGKKEMFLGGTAVDSPLYTFKSGWRGDERSVYSIGSGMHESARISPARKLWRFLPLALVPKMSQLAGKYVF